MEKRGSTEEATPARPRAHRHKSAETLTRTVAHLCTFIEPPCARTQLILWHLKTMAILKLKRISRIRRHTETKKMSIAPGRCELCARTRPMKRRRRQLVVVVFFSSLESFATHREYALIIDDAVFAIVVCESVLCSFEVAMIRAPRRQRNSFVICLAGRFRLVGLLFSRTHPQIAVKRKIDLIQTLLSWRFMAAGHKINNLHCARKS